MARIRTIKPEFWTDDKTGMLSDKAKCLFLGLLNISDDYGVLDFKPNEWRVKIFPYDSQTTTVGLREVLVEELFTNGLIEMFQIRNDSPPEIISYIFIRNFAKHQVINKPSKPLIKGWVGRDNPESYANRIGCEVDTIIPGVLPESYYTTTGSLLPGKERKGKERKEVSYANAYSSSSKSEDKKEAPHETDEGRSIPYGKIVELYHAKLPMLSRVEVVSEKRKTALRVLWTKEKRSHDLSWWEKYFEYVSQSNFLLGQNKNGWRADFEFLINFNNMLKVVEGKYHMPEGA